MIFTVGITNQAARPIASNPRFATKKLLTTNNTEQKVSNRHLWIKHNVNNIDVASAINECAAKDVIRNKLKQMIPPTYFPVSFIKSSIKPISCFFSNDNKRRNGTLMITKEK